MSFGILETILSVLLASLFISVIFRRFQLPIILGYFFVGAMLGPNGLGLIPDIENIKHLAEFGIVFLMFTVGLEFSQPRLFALKHPVFVIGGLQVLFSILITTAIGVMIGMPLIEALVVSGIVAMSSTAIVIKQLSDQLELRSPHGMNAIGILLFQDLAVIPFIILIACLSTSPHVALSTAFLWSFGKGILAICLIALAGRFLLKPLFHFTSKARAMELFTLTVLLVTLTAAWLTDILGLSFALGAFLAGIMLAETEFRHQIEVEIRPFRDILLGLFFITLGMLVDVTHWRETWIWILLLLSALTFGKMLLIIVISRLSGNNTAVALRTGLVLAQGGEFGFAILSLGLSKNIIPNDYGQVILAALVLSIAISPIFIRFNKQIAAFFLPQATRLSERYIRQKILEKSKEVKDHVIICGYGRVGQHVARLLDRGKFFYLGLDTDPELIERAALAGDKVIYGDATHPGILKAARMDKARAVLISINDLRSSIKILSMIRQTHPDMPVIVRCQDEVELMYLKQYGATRVIAETFEEGLSLTHHLFEIMQVPSRKISEMIQDVRNEDYHILRKIFPSSFHQNPNEESLLHEQIRPILLPEGAYAIGHKLIEFDFKQIQVEVIAVRRTQTIPLKPHGNMKFHPNDIVILYGSQANLEEAEKMLLETG